MFTGQWKEEHSSSPNTEKRDHGVHSNGDDVDPALLGSSGGYKQHIQREEASKRHSIWGSRGIHGGIEIRDPFDDLSLLVFVSLAFDQVHKPGEHSHQRTAGAHVFGDNGLRDGAVREGLHAEHGR